MIKVMRHIRLGSFNRQQRIPSRLQLFAFMFSLMCLILMVRTIEITVSSRGSEIGLALSTTEYSPRRDIVDRHGRVLATSVPVASLYADPHHILDPLDAADKLHGLFPHLDKVALAADLASRKRFVWVERNLTPKMQQRVRDLFLPGLGFQKNYMRIYPQGHLAAHVLGYVGLDQDGLAGVEKYFDQELRDTSSQEPLQLSLDTGLQYIVEAELQHGIETYSAKSGAGVILDVHTGEVLALASAPSFDSNQPDPSSSHGFNHATLGRYELGSVFKPINTAIGLELGVVTPNTLIDAREPIKVGRTRIRDYHAKNKWMTVAEVLTYSSNIGSVKIAQLFGSQLQQAFFNKLGLLKAPTIELPEVTGPDLPNDWDKPHDFARVSFGHSFALSPLHFTQAMLPLFNGGFVVPASLRKGGNMGNRERVFSIRTTRQMRALMRMVVLHGSGQRADVDGLGVIGKTGTAEKYNSNGRISSFVGAFPAQDPRFVVFMMLNEPKGTKQTHGFATAGWVTAPLVRSVVAKTASMLRIESNFAEPSTAGTAISYANGGG